MAPTLRVLTAANGWLAHCLPRRADADPGRLPVYVFSDPAALSRFVAAWCADPSARPEPDAPAPPDPTPYRRVL